MVQKVKTSPITSLSRSREIAQVLKEKIIDGSFELQKPVELLPRKSSVGPLVDTSEEA